MAASMRTPLAGMCTSHAGICLHILLSTALVAAMKLPCGFQMFGYEKGRRQLLTEVDSDGGDVVTCGCTWSFEGRIIMLEKELWVSILKKEELAMIGRE